MFLRTQDVFFVCEVMFRKSDPLAKPLLNVLIYISLPFTEN